METVQLTVLCDLSYQTKTDKTVIYKKNVKRKFIVRKSDITNISYLYKGNYVYKTRCYVDIIDKTYLVSHRPEYIQSVMERVRIEGFGK